jgi:hypothetical protein
MILLVEKLWAVRGRNSWCRCRDGLFLMSGLGPTAE